MADFEVSAGPAWLVREGSFPRVERDALVVRLAEVKAEVGPPVRVAGGLS